LTETSFWSLARIPEAPRPFVFSEPSAEAADPELRSIDRLLDLANTALSTARFHTWVLLDRLDVAFAENPELENNALRALFRIYLDLLVLSNVKLKIFLRTDIWTRTTTQGFREASHITRHVTISWNRSSLLSLVVRRAVHNDVQVGRMETGEPEPEGEQLFARPSFKDALPEVSKVRLEQTLYAEYPGQKAWIEKLRGAKTLQTPETLSAIWQVSTEDAAAYANNLATIGFFEARGTRQSPEYWVPFLYRDALDLVQGAAD